MKLLFIYLILIPAVAYSKIDVVTTTTNLKDLVEQVGLKEVSVLSLSKGSQDPHYLEAKPSFIYNLSKADLLISIGAELEKAWLPLVIRGSRNPKLRVGGSRHLVASSYFSLLEKSLTPISKSMGDVHPEGNPHVMLSPSNSVIIAEKIYLKLSELVPEKQTFFKKNFESYKSKITEKLKSWKLKIKPGLKVMSYHKTLSYFYNEFSIENVDVLEPKPGIAPTSSHVIGLIAKIKKQNIKTIIVENYFGDAVAKRIQNAVPSIKIKKVAIAVGGHKKVNSLFELYESLVTSIGN